MRTLTQEVRGCQLLKIGEELQTFMRWLSEIVEWPKNGRGTNWSLTGRLFIRSLMRIRERGPSGGKFNPHSLIDEQKEHGVTTRGYLIETCQTKPHFLSYNVAWDEFCFSVILKQNATVRFGKRNYLRGSENVASKVETLRDDDHFFDKQVLIHVEFLPQGKTVNKKFCVSILKSFRERGHNVESKAVGSVCMTVCQLILPR
jgi:hypothetical protein